MPEHDPTVITALARTPIGAFMGALAPLSAVQLGAHAIHGAVERSRLSVASIDSVLMGCVLPAGLGQAPARQAALQAGLTQAVDATTVNKMCGSGLKAVMLACDGLQAGTANCTVAGGMESMSNAPYLLPKARAGYRYGHGVLLDHLAFDGLEDAYEPGRPMGYFAERCATQQAISRAAQDAYALESLERAQAAQASGAFADELIAVPLTTPGSTTATACMQDEAPVSARADKISRLKPIFDPDGTITAANASSLSDGAAALVLMRATSAATSSQNVLATLEGHSTYGHAPADFPTAPGFAIRRLLDRLSWPINSVDLFEINEAFAVVVLVAMRELSLDRARVNVNGGACALGHPIGASGARILVTLINALRQRGGGRGIASLCIGGGEAVALAVTVPASC